MLALFLAVIACALAFSILFFITYPSDYRQKERRDRLTDISIRPLYLLVLALGFWFFTLPTLLVPYTAQTSYPAYNTIDYNSLTLNSANVIHNTFYPAYTLNFSDPQPIPASFILPLATLWFLAWGTHALLLILYLIEWLGSIGREAVEELD